LQEIQLIDHSLFEKVISEAKQSPRKRKNFNFHELTDVYQRFLNVLTQSTYVAVHRHLNDPKPETFVLLQGQIGFIIFNNDGSIKEKHLLSSEGPIVGIDIKAGVWHNLVCLSEVAVCFEGKSGPYVESVDKEFHPTYLGEGEPGCEKQLKEWKSLFS
jgi:cupin fold WbuC family metalloprotein